MHILSMVEQAMVSGGIASIQFSSEGAVFITTGSSVNKQGGSINGVQFSMIMYSDHITDLSGNMIFQGNSGAFCHKGNFFAVSPFSDGSKVVHTGSCL